MINKIRLSWEVILFHAYILIAFVDQPEIILIQFFVVAEEISLFYHIFVFMGCMTQLKNCY